jgi:transitional endoplasmic reticulum ATPase
VPRKSKLTEEQLEAQEAHKREVLERLAELSGQRLTDDQVMQKGTQLVLPEKMAPAEAVEFLNEYIENQEQATDFNRTFKYRPWDGAVALNRALLRVTGSTGIAKGSGFFGMIPPELRTIVINAEGDTVQVPWGRLAVPMLEGVMSVGEVNNATWGPLFYVSIVAPRKYRVAIEGLFKVVEEELRRESIYKGQAIDGQHQPEFVDLSGVNPDGVIYAEETGRQLTANIWSVLRHTEQLRKLKLARKRAILLEGPYGTGKTLAAFLTAQEAVDNEWTFLYCRPAQDNLHTVMATARLYQPAVVFFEDVDVMTTDEADRDAVSALLDVFDGINAKGTEIMAVLTTNHKERINKAMLRPGRLDAVIHIGEWDQAAIARMVQISVPEASREADLDYVAIYEAMQGFLPAFVKEATDRAMRYAIARNGGEVGVLTTQDFVDAAEGLRPQLDLMEGAKEGKGPEPLAYALRREVVTATRGAMEGAPILDTNEDHVLTLAPGNGNGSE